MARAAQKTTAENVLGVVNEAGKDGVAIKDIALKVGVTVDQARRAVRKLEDDNKVRRGEGNLVVPVTRVGKRHVTVVERDEKILALLANVPEGLTLDQVATEAGTTKRLAYESVWRLRVEGRVKREGATRTARWVAVAA